MNKCDIIPKLDLDDYFSLQIFELSETADWYTIYSHLDWPWDWISISENPNITWTIIQQYPELPWDWSMISKNPNIDLSIILENKKAPWDYWYFFENPNITMNDLCYYFPVAVEWHP